MRAAGTVRAAPNGIAQGVTKSLCMCGSRGVVNSATFTNAPAPSRQNARQRRQDARGGHAVPHAV